MARCKITIIETSFRKEYVDQYVEEERGETIIACCSDGTRPVYFKIEKQG